MTTPVEIVVGNQALTPTEILVATLAAWHPAIDVYVDGTTDVNAIGSQWRVYGIVDGVATRIAEGVFNTSTPTAGQRVLSAVPGIAGTTFELRALRPGGPTTGVLRAAIVGWDPEAQTATAADSDFSVHSIPSSTTETLFATVPWHPRFSASASAAASVNLGLTSWKVYAEVTGFVFDIPIAQGAYPPGQTGAQQVTFGGGGAASWKLKGAGPGGAAANVTGSLVAYSPAGASGSSVNFQTDVFISTLDPVTEHPIRVFTLSATPNEPANLIVSVNGTIYVQPTDYTIVGTTLTWLDVAFPMAVNDRIVAYYEKP